MNEPKLTVTPAGYAIDAQALLDEIVRLEGLVASVTAERDSARDLAARAQVFTSPADDESTFSHVLNNGLCEVCGAARNTNGDSCSFGYCDWCDNLRPTPPAQPVDRPSAYVMPVGSVVVTATSTYSRTGSDDWRTGQGRHRIRSGWIEGLFSDGLVTEWRMP